MGVLGVLHDYSGERLRSLRKKAMLTQMQVVQRTGVCEATLYNVEKGVRRPQTRTLEKLLSLYAIRIQYWKNANKVFEENTNGGNLSTQTTQWPRGPGLDARRSAQKT